MSAFAEELKLPDVGPGAADSVNNNAFATIDQDGILTRGQSKVSFMPEQFTNNGGEMFVDPNELNKHF